MIDFDKIRNLSDDYYHHRITKQEYREYRKSLLNKIDKEINNVDSVGLSDTSEKSVVNKIISFFKSSDEERVI